VGYLRERRLVWVFGVLCEVEHVARLVDFSALQLLFEVLVGVCH